MRKKIAVLLVAVLLLTGCAGKKQPAGQTGTGDNPGQTGEQTTDKPGNGERAVSFKVETVRFDGTEKTDEGVMLVSYAFQVPMLTVCREDGTQVTEAKNKTEEEALAKAQTFNTKFEEWTQAADIEGMAASAKEHLESMKEFDSPWVGGYAMDLSCGIYQTERMVSVSAVYYSYTGGAHPNTYHMGWNFDLETGSFLDVKMLGEDDGLQKAVTEEILRRAKQVQGADEWIPIEMYWEDHESIIADWSSYAVGFDEEGMTVIFSAYELAPYAAGAQEFHFTYEFLEPYLSAQGKLLLGL